MEKQLRNIYTITYTKDGVEKVYLIPSTSLENALVRLGQIYGDKEDREDVVIEIISIAFSKY